MEIKLFEVRDEGTLMPAMAIRISGADGGIMRRAGFGSPQVYMVWLEMAECHWDPFTWVDRTRHYAHSYIAKYWERLTDRQVIDVRCIADGAMVAAAAECEA